ncbi:hypothetical protein B0I37DRAFT_38194 [Chaetomium sp. MPI-CAGE-AT-0009]|nr:hypothetical protein B0I37DRAFT_38194 [Chaetomium sp. MPI-CAGE-AT-0009]
MYLVVYLQLCRLVVSFPDLRVSEIWNFGNKTRSEGGTAYVSVLPRAFISFTAFLSFPSRGVCLLTHRFSSSS